MPAKPPANAVDMGGKSASGGKPLHRKRGRGRHTLVQVAYGRVATHLARSMRSFRVSYVAHVVPCGGARELRALLCYTLYQRHTPSMG